MSEELKGLELFLSSEKAVQGANTFRTAVESCALAVERIGAVVDRLDAVLEHLGKTTKGVPDPVKQLGREADGAADKMKKAAAGATEFDRKLVGLGSVARGAAGQLAALTGSIGGLLTLRSAAGAIKESEDKLRILQSVTGATAREMDLLSTAANSLSLNTRFSFGDATQTLINLTKAGATASEAITALPTVSNLARAGLLSLDQAGDTVIQTMSQFGLTITDAARIGDVLVKAADSTTSSVDTLADSLRKVGPVGREFGVSLETVTAAIAQMQQQGIEARIAGTGLSRIFQQLADPANGPEGAAQALHQLNLSFDDVHPRNFAKALDNLGKAGLTLKDAIALVGTEFGYLLTSMVRSRGEIKSLDSALQSAGGDSAKKAAATVGTLGDSIDKLGNAAQRFYREGGRAGLSRALSEIAVTGTDALNVLLGDAEAMKSASTSGQVLAGSLKLAGAAMAGFLAFRAIERIGTIEKAMAGAGKAISGIAAAVRASPVAAYAAVVAAAGTALFLFGGQADEAALRLARFNREAADAAAIARRFDAIRASILAGNSAAVDDLARSLREQLSALAEMKKQGVSEVSLDQVLPALASQAPELVGKLRAVTNELMELGKAGQPATAKLKTELRELELQLTGRFGLQMRHLGEFVTSLLGNTFFIFKGFTFETSEAATAIGNSLNHISGRADAAKEALAAAAKASQDLQRGGAASAGGGAPPEARRADLLQQMLRDKVAELALADQSEEKQRRAKLLQEALNAAIASGRKLRYEELLALEFIARQQDRAAGKKSDERRAEAVQKILAGLRDENALLGEQGAAREALQKRQETISALAEAKVDASSAEYKQALELLGVYEQLLVAEEQRNKASKGQARRERRGDDAFRALEQEERSLQLVGAEREKYLRQIEAENELRQTGLDLNSADAQDFVRRKVAAAELASAQRELAQIGSEVGSSIGGSLERIIIDMEKGRDVAKAFAQDLARLAFRQTVTNNLQGLLSSAGTALAGYFGGGAAAGAGGTGAAGSGFNNGGGDPYNMLRGGIIPALDGQIVTQPSFLQRAGRTYSIAEGGRSTPEIVMRLQRDQRGNLGVAAVGGAGGGPTTMIFPNVRDRRDARAVRATMGQRVGELTSVAQRKGRRGLRP